MIENIIRARLIGEESREAAHQNLDRRSQFFLQGAACDLTGAFCRRVFTQSRRSLFDVDRRGIDVASLRLAFRIRALHGFGASYKTVHVVTAKEIEKIA